MTVQANFNNIHQLEQAMQGASLKSKRFGGYKVVLGGHSYSRNKLAKMAIEFSKRASDCNQFISVEKQINALKDDGQPHGKLWKFATSIRQSWGNKKFKRLTELQGHRAVLEQKLLPKMAEVPSPNLQKSFEAVVHSLDPLAENYNHMTGVALLKELHKEGSRAATHLLARIYLRGEHGVPRDLVYGFEILKQLHDSGYQESENDYALGCIFGWGGNPDPEYLYTHTNKDDLVAIWNSETVHPSFRWISLDRFVERFGFTEAVLEAYAGLAKENVDETFNLSFLKRYELIVKILKSMNQDEFNPNSIKSRCVKALFDANINDPIASLDQGRVESYKLLFSVSTFVKIAEVIESIELYLDAMSRKVDAGSSLGSYLCFV